MVKWLAIAIALGACGTFEDPNVVIDLRVLAMTADPPEQVVDVSTTTDPVMLLQQVVPTHGLRAGRGSQLRRAIFATRSRCARRRATIAASPIRRTRCSRTGVLPDPDTFPRPTLCTTIQPDGNLLGVLLDYLNADQLHGIGGIYYGRRSADRWCRRGSESTTSSPRRRCA